MAHNSIWTDPVGGYRPKERCLIEVIQKLEQVIDLFSGVIIAAGQDGKPIELAYDIEQACKFTGLPRKSVEDYRSQLRKALSYGFDFDS